MPPSGLATVSIGRPEIARKAGVISPRNCVELTNVVLSGALDNLATAPETKPVPLIVRRNA